MSNVIDFTAKRLKVVEEQNRVATAQAATAQTQFKSFLSQISGMSEPDYQETLRQIRLQMPPGPQQDDLLAMVIQARG